MKDSALIREFVSLPPEAQKQVMDFVAFLKTRYPEKKEKKQKKSHLLEKEPFIGMWQDREDMKDSSEWVRNTRQKEWSGNGLDEKNSSGYGHSH
ncbi:DUF2281 domain-containing protein [Desulfobotulus mexicanus]|uniref:DUF2281 domain-containing protein n=1 Tax=Desulfobotulus mexicanus TaxID=2586642 RepID=A0A5S5MCA2_9BACT|nr:DUF2281 domain-containing protein [Desulfobotulus mexicanus]TYT73343.1 DUF2281 domain-containing protein [Desulfobotulus mexicanus]